jgi:hypothetical protein
MAVMTTDSYDRVDGSVGVIVNSGLIFRRQSILARDLDSRGLGCDLVVAE